MQTDMKTTSLVFIGHIDAGKSTTIGRILVELDLVPQQTLDRYKALSKEYKKESWYLSYLLDTEEQERKKGKTAELNRVLIKIKDRRFYLIDSPGHKDYVIEMLRACVTARVAVLIVSAKTGEFESGFEREGQTKEHLMLACTMGIENLLIVVNKIDEINFEEKRIENIREKVEKFAKTLFKKIEFVYISAQKNLNIKNENSFKNSDENNLNSLDNNDENSNKKVENLTEMVKNNLSLKKEGNQYNLSKKNLIDLIYNYKIQTNNYFCGLILDSEKTKSELFIKSGNSELKENLYLINPAILSISDFNYKNFPKSQNSENKSKDFPSTEKELELLKNSVKSNKISFKEIRDFQDNECLSLESGEYYSVKPSVENNSIIVDKNFFNFDLHNFPFAFGNILFLSLNILKRDQPVVITKGYSAVAHIFGAIEEFKVLEVFVGNKKVKIAPLCGKVNIKIALKSCIGVEKGCRVAIRDRRDTVAIGIVKCLRFEVV